MMAPRILAFSGRKQAGKSTAAAFLLRNARELFRLHPMAARDTARVYSFAGPLKRMCVEVFGLDEESVYGTDVDKSRPTHLLWEKFPNLAAVHGREGPMTGREVLQYAGTEIFRHWDGDVWARATVRQILLEDPPLALIDDLRFPNEADAVRSAGGKVIRLTRAPAGPDDHPSETAMDGYPDFDVVIDNADMTADETHRAVIHNLREWGWLP